MSSEMNDATSARVDMTGNIRSSPSAKTNGGELVETRKERSAKRSEEERRAKAKAGDTKKGRRAKPAPSGKRDTAKRGGPRAATPGAVQHGEDDGRPARAGDRAISPARASSRLAQPSLIVCPLPPTFRRRDTIAVVFGPRRGTARATWTVRC